MDSARKKPKKNYKPSAMQPDAPDIAFQVTSAGMGRGEIARRLGVTGQTVRNWMQDHAVFRAKVIEGETKWFDYVSAQIRTALESGNTAAINHALKGRAFKDPGYCSIELPDIDTLDDVRHAQNLILQSASAGVISDDRASHLLKIVGDARDTLLAKERVGMVESIEDEARQIVEAMRAIQGSVPTEDDGGADDSGD